MVAASLTSAQVGSEEEELNYHLRLLSMLASCSGRCWNGSSFSSFGTIAFESSLDRSFPGWIADFSPRADDGMTVLEVDPPCVDGRLELLASAAWIGFSEISDAMMGAESGALGG